MYEKFKEILKMKIKTALLLICCLVLTTVFASCNGSDSSNFDNIENISNSEVIAQADKLAAEGDYQAALDLINAKLEHSPNSSKLQAKAKEYTLAITEQNINSIIEQAEKAASVEDFQGALDIIMAALNSNPDSEKLQTKVEEYTLAIETKDIASIIETADQAFAKGDFKGAIAKIEAGLILYPDSFELTVKIEQYNSEIENADVQKILENAEIFANEKDWASALKTINDGLKLYPDSALLKSKVAGYTTEHNKQMQSIALADAAAYAEIGEYYQAMSVIQKAQNSYGSNAECQKAYNTYYKLYKIDITVQEAADYAQMEEYSSAIQVIDYTIKEVGTDTELQNARAEYLTLYLSQVTSLVNAYIEDSDYENAIKAVVHAIEIDDNSQFQSLKKTTETKYVKYITDTIDKQLKNEKYTDASKTVSNALSILPSNAELKKLQVKVKDATPVYLLDVCEPYATKWYDQCSNGRTMQIAGTTYTNGFTLGDDGYALFNLGNSNYSTLSFIVGHIADTDRQNLTLYLYCDNILVKEVQLSWESLPQKVSLDISGSNQIKFLLSHGSAYHYGFAEVTVN